MSTGGLPYLRRLSPLQEVFRRFGSHLRTGRHDRQGHGLVGEGCLSLLLSFRRQKLEFVDQRNVVVVPTFGREFDRWEATFGSVAFAARVSGRRGGGRGHIGRRQFVE